MMLRGAERCIFDPIVGGGETVVEVHEFCFRAHDGACGMAGALQRLVVGFGNGHTG